MDRLVRSVSPRMQQQLTGYGLDADERADALQNALLQIVRRLSSFREESLLSTWIFRVTANAALLILRTRRRNSSRVVYGRHLEVLSSLVAMDDSDGVEASFCAARRAARVRREIARLPSSYGAVLVAHYLDELDLCESSARLGVSVAAVKGRLWRARECMRTAMAGAESAP